MTKQHISQGESTTLITSPVGSVPWLPVVSLAASAPGVHMEVERVANLAGIEIHAVPPGGGRLSAVLNLVEVRSSVARVRASFHPAYASYFASGSLELTLPDEAEDLLELILAAGTTRRCPVVAVVGAHGGAGASTTAAWLARMWARVGSVALIDADPTSSGIDRLLALDGVSGVRWADLEQGVLVPGRLKIALPALGRLRVLSADRRGSVEASGSAAIAALSQVADVCVVDLAPEALVRGSHGNDLLEWADVVVLVSRSGPTNTGRLMTALTRVPPGTELVIAGVGMGAGEAAALMLEANLETIVPVRILKGLAKDIEHGVAVGERRRSATRRDIAALARACGVGLA